MKSQILCLALLFAVSGCKESGLIFHCTMDPQCGDNGRCIAGYCAFPDDCPGGLRYDPSAGDHANECVASADLGTAPVDMNSMQSADDLGISDMTPAHVSVWKRYVISGINMSAPSTVWGTNAHDLYSIATDTTTMRDSIWHSQDGVNWTEQYAVPASGGNVSTIWGPNPQRVFATGVHLLLQTTGDGSWAPPTSLFPANTDVTKVSSVFGWDTNNFYFSALPGINGSPSSVFHVSPSGGAFEPIGANYPRLWGTGPSDIYGLVGGFLSPDPIGVYHSTGNGAWTSTTLPCPGVAGWGSSATDAYILAICSLSANTTYQVYHSTGNNDWPTLPQASISTQGVLTFIYGASPTNIYIGGPVYHSSGDGNWTLDSTLNSMNDTVTGMWGPTSDTIFAIAYDSSKNPVMWIYQ